MVTFHSHSLHFIALVDCSILTLVMRIWKFHGICVSRLITMIMIIIIIIIIIIILIIIFKIPQLIYYYYYYYCGHHRENALVSSMLRCSFVNKIFQGWVLLRSCMNAIHRRRSNTPRQSLPAIFKSSSGTRPRRLLTFFSRNNVKSSALNKLCCSHIDSTCYRVP